MTHAQDERSGREESESDVRIVETHEGALMCHPKRQKAWLQSTIAVDLADTV